MWRRNVAGWMLGCALLSQASLAAAGDENRFVDRPIYMQPETYTWSFAKFATGEREFWLEGEVIDAIRYEIMSGYPVASQEPLPYLRYQDREMRGRQEMREHEFAVALVKALGLVPGPSGNGVWWQPYVDQLAMKGIIATSDHFEADRSLTRLMAARWLARAANFLNADANLPAPEFTDLGDIPAGDRPLVRRVAMAGIFRGSDGAFHPNGTVDREVGAVLLLRLARANNNWPAGESATSDALAMQEVIRNADSEASDRGAAWARRFVQETWKEHESIHDIIVAPGQYRTSDFAQYLQFWARTSAVMHDHFPRTWGSREGYVFTMYEQHVGHAIVGVCATTRVYELWLSYESPLGNIHRNARVETERAPTNTTPGIYRSEWLQESCGYQYMVKRDGKWLIAAAVARLPAEGGNSQ